MSKADRMLSVLWMLRSGRRITDKQLADKLEIHIRTVYRYIDALCASGVPIIWCVVGYCHLCQACPQLALIAGGTSASVGIGLNVRLLFWRDDFPVLSVSPGRQLNMWSVEGAGQYWFAGTAACSWARKFLTDTTALIRPLAGIGTI